MRRIAGVEHCGRCGDGGPWRYGLCDNAPARIQHGPTTLHRRICVTDDGWRLGIRQFIPREPDPDKLPVVLCHGLGLNGTFWTITDDHLPGQLAARGYEVFICRHARARGEPQVGPRRQDQRGARGRPPSWRSARRRWTWTTWPCTTSRRSSTTSRRETGRRPGQLGRPQPGRDADVPVSGAVARAPTGSPTSWRWEVGDPRRSPRAEDAPRRIASFASARRSSAPDGPRGR